MNIFQRFLQQSIHRTIGVDYFQELSKTIDNIYNKVTFEWVGGSKARYDYNNRTYLEKGYGENPDIAAIVNQQANKTKSIPFEVKRIEDEKYRKSIEKIFISTKGNYTHQQKRKIETLESKAYSDKEVKFPLERPNPFQTWSDIWFLYKVYMKITGNAYLYMQAPTGGNNEGEPKLVYILPSHLVQLELKEGAGMLDTESPIKCYLLTEGETITPFPAEDVIHIKYANPFYDLKGSHLYGLSPLRSALKLIENSNDFIEHNLKTGKNGGVFGFISGKDQVLSSDHAKAIKEQMQEMDLSNGRLSKIAGMSVPIDFTKISLDTDALKPFDYLQYNQKQFCNLLGWSDKLMNNDSGAKYENINEEKKRVLIDDIIPDLKLLADSLNKEFLPRFKNLQNCVIEWDYSELPEMQEDIVEMLKWAKDAYLTPNEIRTMVKYETLKNVENMDVPLIASNMIRIDEMGLSTADIQNAFGNNENV